AQDHLDEAGPAKTATAAQEALRDRATNLESFKGQEPSDEVNSRLAAELQNLSTILGNLDKSIDSLKLGESGTAAREELAKTWKGLISARNGVQAGNKIDVSLLVGQLRNIDNTLRRILKENKPDEEPEEDEDEDGSSGAETK
ncbi:MAG: hypothetical protein RB292_00005, partial [Patescibacteria group bacterium]|nr:hypothetical protein [Patescibacteria group bacterium]